MSREKNFIASLPDQYKAVINSYITDGYLYSMNPNQLAHPKQLFENIWVVGGDWPSHVSGAFVYFVGSQRRGVLIESGCQEGTANVIQNLIPIGSPHIEAVYITHFHPDHADAVNYWHDAGVPTFGSRRGIEGVNRMDPGVYLSDMYYKKPTVMSVDNLLDGNQTVKQVNITFDVLNTEGHTDHDLSLVLNTRDKKGKKVKVGFLGDTVYGGAIEGMSNLSNWRQSLALIDSLKLDAFMIGHIKPLFRKRMKTFCEQFTQSDDISQLPLSFKSMRTPWI